MTIVLEQPAQRCRAAGSESQYVTHQLLHGLLAVNGMCVYIYIYIYMYVYIYIYIHRYVCVYIYIYIYIHTQVMYSNSMHIHVLMHHSRRPG